MLYEWSIARSSTWAKVLSISSVSYFVDVASKVRQYFSTARASKLVPKSSDTLPSGSVVELFSTVRTSSLFPGSISSMNYSRCAFEDPCEGRPRGRPFETLTLEKPLCRSFPSGWEVDKKSSECGVTAIKSLLATSIQYPKITTGAPDSVVTVKQ